MRRIYLKASNLEKLKQAQLHGEQCMQLNAAQKPTTQTESAIKNSGGKNQNDVVKQVSQ